VAGLARWRKRAGDRRLAVFFHELWSSGPPWSSVFYVGGLQALAARRLRRLADVSLTSAPRMQRMLDGIGSNRTHLIPVPSNIAAGAVASRAPWAADAALRLMIFGQAGTRMHAVRSHEALLRELERRGRLGRVAVVGKGAQADGPEARALAVFLPAGRIEVRGEMPEADVAAEFAAAQACLSFYPASLVTKSGTAMAALAHGCPLVLKEGRDADPLVPGEHFLACDGSAPAVERFLQDGERGQAARVSVHGRAWYLAHADWPMVARRWTEALGV